MKKRIALLVALLVVAFVLVSLATGFETAVTGTRITGKVVAQAVSHILIGVATGENIPLWVFHGLPDWLTH